MNSQSMQFGKAFMGEPDQNKTANQSAQELGSESTATAENKAASADKAALDKTAAGQAHAGQTKIADTQNNAVSNTAN
ncbi:MAG: hypothetical protein J0M35_04930, partial [Candidatus Obscuribacter phosphatis]|nr:hypothetical protein [Candidatus Obscuribacter phosphatis]